MAHKKMKETFSSLNIGSIPNIYSISGKIRIW